MIESNGGFKAILCASALLVALAATAGAGQGVWTSGGPYGGRVTALGVDPGDRSRVVAATSATAPGPISSSLTGVFTSQDGGKTWSPSTLSSALPSIQCLTFDPTNPETVYAGISANGVSGYIARSQDGGHTWNSSSLGPVITFVSTIAVDSLHPSTVYAATDQGAFKSMDGGATWSARNTGLPDCSQSCGLGDIAIDPANPQVLFTLAAGTVYESENGAGSWHLANAGIPPGAFGKALAIDPFDDRIIFVGTQAGVFKSANGGANWSQSLNAALPSFDSIVSIEVDPANPQHVIAASGGSGIFETQNVGVSWNETSSIATYGSREAIAFSSAGILLLGSLSSPGVEGVLISQDPSKGWSPSNRGIQGIELAAIVADPFDDRKAYALGYLSNLYVTADSGGSWAENHAFGGNVLAPDPSNPGVLFAAGGSATGVFVEKSLDGGASWQGTATVIDTGDRFNQVRAKQLAVAPGSSGVLYLTISGNLTGGFFRSEDGGVTWSRIGATLGVSEIALDRNSPSTLYALVTSPSDPTQGLLYKSTDFGSTFALLSSLPNGVPGALAVAPGSPSTLYYAATEPAGNRIDVSRSSNGGVSWSPAGTSLPGSITESLVVSPLNAQEVFLAATSGGASEPGGAFRSRNGGATWQDFSGGLPDGSVTSLAIDPTGGTLHAATLAGVYEFTFGRPNLNIAPAPAAKPRPISRPVR